MRIEVVPFEDWHYMVMDVRKEDDLDLRGADLGDLFEGWKTCETVLVDGEPAFFYGSLVENGRGYLWAVTSHFVDKMPLYCTRRARARVREMFQQGAYVVEAYCHKANARGLRWLRRGLGMSVVGEMDADRWWLSVKPEDVRYV